MSRWGSGLLCLLLAATATSIAIATLRMIWLATLSVADSTPRAARRASNARRIAGLDKPPNSLISGGHLEEQNAVS